MDADARMALIEQQFRRTSIVLVGIVALAFAIYSIWRILRTCAVACAEIFLYVVILAASSYIIALVLRSVIVVLDGAAFFNTYLRPLGAAIQFAGAYINATQTT